MQTISSKLHPQIRTLTLRRLASGSWFSMAKRNTRSKKSRGLAEKLKCWQAASSHIFSGQEMLLLFQEKVSFKGVQTRSYMDRDGHGPAGIFFWRQFGED